MTSSSRRLPTSLLALSVITTALLLVLQGCRSEGPQPGPPAYFSTSRPEKIAATVITETSQLEEVLAFSNSFSPVGATLPQLGQYLRANANRMLPIVGIDNFLLDPQSGLLRADYGAALSDVIATVSANHSGEILFLFDELLWDIRTACDSRRQAACDEVEQRYANTLAQVRAIGQELRRRVPGSGILHVESSAELSLQMIAWNQIVVFDDAEYLGFDCYGAIDDCGGRPQRDYFTWIVNARNALEAVNPIGRKIFLVPGAFRDFYAFPEESLAIAQLNQYFQILDSSEIHGAIGTFTWGDVLGAANVFMGARNLPRVRAVLADLMRARIRKDVPLAFPPALSVVGAFRPDASTWQASFSSVRVPRGIDALLFVQSAGVDACTLARTGHDPVALTVNELQSVLIAGQTGAVMDATADCAAGGTSLRKSVRFEFQ